MLYVVGTPIGNLSEMTPRAVEILKSVDYIACEDTRTSGVLLHHYGITTPKVAYHKFNETQKSISIIDDLKMDKNVAVISDAGMPGVSDPGQILIKQAIQNQIKINVVSGPCALISAFVLSGLDSPFTFVGFLPKKSGEITKTLNKYKDYATTLIFYVSPRDVVDQIKIMYQVFGDRKIAIVRELTKVHESVEYSTLKHGYNGVCLGEFVLVVDGAVDNVDDLVNMSIIEQVNYYINLGDTKNDAIKKVANTRSLAKNVVYQEYIKNTKK